jgi:hypothetical protein
MQCKRVKQGEYNVFEFETGSRSESGRTMVFARTARTDEQQCTSMHKYVPIAKNYDTIANRVLSCHRQIAIMSIVTSRFVHYHYHLAFAPLPPLRSLLLCNLDPLDHSVVRVLHTNKLSSSLDVVGSAEQSVNFLKTDSLRLRDEKYNE